jgi:hypothetical protein
MYKVELNPEISRIAQASAATEGVSFRNVLARAFVEQAVTELDWELNLVLEPQESLCEASVFAKAGANDIVINGTHIHVVALDETGVAELPNGFLTAGYMDGGALVVKILDATHGVIVGHLSAATLLDASQMNTGLPRLFVNFQSDSQIDLAKTLNEVLSAPKLAKASLASPRAEDYVTFGKNPDALAVPAQRQIVSFCCENSWARENLVSMTSTFGNLPNILQASSVWAKRVDTLLDKLSGRSKVLGPDQLRRIIEETGEKFGGQPESPLFRKALLHSIAREELASKLSPESLVKVVGVVDLIVTGKSVMDGVKSFVRNEVAVELARSIAAKRENLTKFTQATAEEVGSAFQSLALQPAYATHSPGEQLAMEDINQALMLMEAGDWLQSISDEI